VRFVDLVVAICARATLREVWRAFRRVRRDRHVEGDEMFPLVMPAGARGKLSTQEVLNFPLAAGAMANGNK
jgi:hypothetical protein